MTIEASAEFRINNTGQTIKKSSRDPLVRIVANTIVMVNKCIIGKEGVIIASIGKNMTRHLRKLLFIFLVLFIN